jgi:hypothetical protein
MGSVIQTSFNSGEWSPALFARVDLQKFHSGAALIRNWFVDYRGGVTTKPGSKYILQAKSNSTVRLIPFQASLTVSYMLEFGLNYIRFINNGSYVLEAAKTISGANIGTSTLTITSNGYSNGDWIFINGIVGTLGNLLNGNYFIVASAATNTIKLTDLNGNTITFTGAYTSGGTAQRVYTVATTYLDTEVFGIKYAQDVNILFLCHPNHAPSQLVLNTSNVQPSWTFGAITFGSTVTTPTGTNVTTNATSTGDWLSYVMTAVDVNGQESAPTNPFGIANVNLASGYTNTVSWTPVVGAVAYNIYKTTLSVGSALPVGQPYGFIGTATGSSFIDQVINPDFSQSPPIVQNPFSGSGVQSVAITSGGTYTPSSVPLANPSVTFSGGGGSGATGIAVMAASALAITNGGSGYTLNGIYPTGAPGVSIQVTSLGTFNSISTAILVSTGSFTGSMPGNSQNVPGGSSTAQVQLSYQVVSVGITSPGTGYGSPPTVAFGFGSASATAVLGSPSAGNPTVPMFHQQRSFFGGPVSSPSQFNMSQPGAIYNFNITYPAADDNAIQDTFTNSTLNTIKSAVSTAAGLIVFADKAAWLLNSGSSGSAIGALTITANPQSYAGASDLPPIVTPNDILYVQAKGSIVRDLAYNFYLNSYVGADISVLSSHLFYGFSMVQWAWAEEPFKVAWVVRSDGTLLSLTFVKEQELIAWAHSDTQGSYKSIATVTEQTALGSVDAIYTVVQRSINGNTVNYIERMVELYYPVGLTDAWQVDAGIQFNGASALTFSGAQHLAGAMVTGLATDNLGNVTVIPAFAMPTNGTFTLAAPTAPATGYTRVTVGLPFTPQLQTLPLDLGEPTVQGKRKKISAVTLRCQNALGLSMGSIQANIKPIQSLILGNVNEALNAPITGLVTADARAFIDPDWNVPGQYFIEQDNPYPASILGVIPEIEVGDT